MVNEQNFADLSLEFRTKRSCAMRLVTLVWLPLVIFLIVIGGYMELVPLKTEIHSVILIGIIFIIFLFFMRHNAFYAACQFKKRFEPMKMELSAYINNNLLSIVDTTKANVPFEGFIKEFSSTLRNENFSSVAAGIFPTLGILGTFISIAISMPDFSSQTSEALEQEISLLLGGVGTAFYVSIYGIFLSIWWIFYEKTGVSSFEKDVRMIKQATRVYFWEKEEIEQTYFQKSMENFEKLNAVFDTISSQVFIENMNRTLEQRMMIFDTIIEREQKAVESASLQVRQGIEEAAVIRQQQEVLFDTHKEMIEQMRQFTMMLEESGKEVALSNELLGNNQNGMQEISRQLSGNIEQLNAALVHISAENIQNVYSGVIENIETMKSDIDRIGASFDQRLNDFDAEFLVKLKETLKMIDHETSEIVTQLSELKQDEDKAL